MLLSDIRSLEWTEERGRKLKEIRGSMSLRDLAGAIQANGESCSWQNIAKLENGVTETVRVKTLLAILNACGRGIDSLYSVGTFTRPIDNQR